MKPQTCYEAKKRRQKKRGKKDFIQVDSNQTG